MTIDGSSSITAFGNATWITVEDVTDPAHPIVLAGFNPARLPASPNAVVTFTGTLTAARRPSRASRA
jgi:hypothetical protein